jgi:Phage integrase, N-terminal SAM-like domain
MRVQRVLVPGGEWESWTLLGEDHSPVEPVDRFLGYLSSIERSPNTVKAYGHDLKDWFTFLGVRRLDWREVSLEDVAGFVAWLRLPPPARDGGVRVLWPGVPYCTDASVRRKLMALASFCEFHARTVVLDGLLVSLASTGRAGAASRSFKPFLRDAVRARRGSKATGTCSARLTRPAGDEGRPDVEGFIAGCLLAGRDRIDFSGLTSLLKLEFRYAVQCRVDQGTIRLPAPVVAWAIRQVRDAGAASLLDLSPTSGRAARDPRRTPMVLNRGP